MKKFAMKLFEKTYYKRPEYASGRVSLTIKISYAQSQDPNGAHFEDRTRDLFLTKEVLYH